MKTRFLYRILLAGLLALAATNLHAAGEAELIGILQSSAGVPEKCAACEQLKIIGTAQSVPALAVLLTNERTSHAARYALEAIPAPEAGAALREALGKTTGMVKIGLIHSLGRRGEPEGLPLLKPLLSDSDPAIAGAAAAALGQIGGPDGLAALSAARAKSPPALQLAVANARLQCAERLLTDGEKPGAATVYRSLFDAKLPPQIRVAAWRGLVLSDPAKRVKLMAEALAGGDRWTHLAALKVVRELSDAPVIKACLKHWVKLPADAQVALVDASLKLGAKALPIVRAAAGSDHLNVRLAAWQALANLADSSLLPALAKAAAQGAPDERDAARNTLTRLHGPGVDQAILKQMSQGEPAAKAELLRALGERDDRSATAVLLQYADNADEAVRLAALASLKRLAVADTFAPLLNLATQAKSESNRNLVMEALSAICQATPDKALAIAKRPEEKRQALGQIGQIPTPVALQTALAEITDSNLSNEAGLAAVSIAEKVAAAHPQLAEETAVKVLAYCQSANILQRAWALRPQSQINAPFIKDWLVCGPYRSPGAVGAQAVFNVAFGPENPGEAVTWKPLPRADHANLGTYFPDQMNCAAYLKARIFAPQDRKAALLIGSDDGVKAWLNGTVVHSDNVDRGMVPDQGVALIELKKGTNELQLKITQGGGGWSACARIVGADGQPIAGLRVEPQGGTELPAAAPAPQPAPKPVPAVLPKRDAFRNLRLSDLFYAEGAACGDFNQDGKPDVVAGPFWFEGPDFTKRHEYRPAKSFDPHEYSDNFLTFTGDFNGDGRTDILCVPFPGKEGYWYENPGDKAGPWKQHLYYPMVGNESPGMEDMDSDGRPDLIFNNEGYLGYATYDPAKPDAEWTFHAVSPQDKRFQRFTHGIGAGDINGDGRKDLLEAAGWWEQPADARNAKVWIFHPHQFAEAASQLLVTDVDGDGLNDVICAWHCHQYGLLWWQQKRGADGEITWQRHEILSPTPDVHVDKFRFSQPHAMALADMNGDGLMDIVTGKRFWAHGPTGDVEPNAPAVLCWFELQRGPNGQARFIPHLIDDNSGVGTQVTVADLNADHRPDVIVANKKGVFVHLNELPRK